MATMDPDDVEMLMRESYVSPIIEDSPRLGLATSQQEVDNLVKLTQDAQDPRKAEAMRRAILRTDPAPDLDAIREGTSIPRDDRLARNPSMARARREFLGGVAEEAARTPPPVIKREPLQMIDIDDMLDAGRLEQIERVQKGLPPKIMAESFGLPIPESAEATGVPRAQTASDLADAERMLEREQRRTRLKRGVQGGDLPLSMHDVQKTGIPLSELDPEFESARTFRNNRAKLHNEIRTRELDAFLDEQKRIMDNVKFDRARAPSMLRRLAPKGIRKALTTAAKPLAGPVGAALLLQDVRDAADLAGAASDIGQGLRTTGIRIPAGAIGNEREISVTKGNLIDNPELIQFAPPSVRERLAAEGIEFDIDSPYYSREDIEATIGAPTEQDIASMEAANQIVGANLFTQYRDGAIDEQTLIDLAAEGSEPAFEALRLIDSSTPSPSELDSEAVESLL